MRGLRVVQGETANTRGEAEAWPQAGAPAGRREVTIWNAPGLGIVRLLSPAAWRTWLLVAGLVAGALLVTWPVIGSSVGVYLPPDGAHYIADADGLLGRGVRELRHPPLFPALVAAARLVVDDVGSFHTAMGVSLGLLAVGLFVLLRRWVGPGPSLLGAATGVLMPTTAELIGWGGGATLLGLACLVLALAAMESWIGGLRFGGLLAGAGLGATALAHPFVFGVALACVGVRWLLLLMERRRLGLGWDPLGLAGMGLLLLPIVPCLLLAAPYYLGVEGGGGFGLRVPQLGGLTDLLSWALGTNPLAWALLAVGILAPIAFGHRGPLIYAAFISVLATWLSTSLAADTSYVTRIAYVFPVVVAAGVGTGAQVLKERLGDLIRRLPRGLAPAAATLLVLAVAASSYGPRLERASMFYQLLEPEDVRVLRGLQGGEGVVATSWHGPHYGSGVSTSWFVEGLSKRSAFGPTAPWLSTVPEQRRVGKDMQRLFAGTEGLENGVLQLAAGPPGVRADPAVQVFSDGFYFPVLYANSLVNTHPAAFEGDSERAALDETLTWTYRDGDGRAVIRQEAHLEGRAVIIRYEVGGRLESGSWSLWYWPAYGVHWKDVRTGPGVVEARQGLPEEDVTFRISADEAEVVYHRLEPRFGVEAIEVRADGVRSVEVRVEVEARAQPGPAQVFDEREIVTRRGVAEVVVWKDSGWRDRFDRDPCYVLVEDSRNILVYEVRLGLCGVRADG